MRSIESAISYGHFPESPTWQRTSANRTESRATFGQISAVTGLTAGNNGGPQVIQRTERINF